MLDVSWYKPSGDQWTFSGPTIDESGVANIGRESVTERISSDDFPYSKSFDITDSIADGLIFNSVAGGKTVSVPIFLPSRSR